LASDGKWYPQRWEYNWAHRSGTNALRDLGNRADELGQSGWEMVSHWYLDQGMQERCNAFFKRPIQP
jgi:hypothetical protein